MAQQIQCANCGSFQTNRWSYGEPLMSAGNWFLNWIPILGWIATSVIEGQVWERNWPAGKAKAK